MQRDRDLTEDGAGGLIHNQGVIEAADGGFVVLLGDSVLNEGAVLAELGSIDLAAGRSATLDFDGSGLLLFEVGFVLLAAAAVAGVLTLAAGSFAGDAIRGVLLR